MTRGKIFVCFIGTDGSGKSTLADNVFTKLKNKKIRVRKIYGRHQHALSRLAIKLGRKFFLKNRDMFTDYDKYLRDKRSLFVKSSLAVKIYIYLLVIEYILQIFFKITMPLRFGYSIVADRYIHDTVINDIAIDTGMSFDNVMTILTGFQRYSPKPDAIFFVEVPETIAFSRKNDIPSIHYLEIRNQFYKHLAGIRDQNITTLQGTLPISELGDKVFHILNELTNHEIERS